MAEFQKKLLAVAGGDADTVPTMKVWQAIGIAHKRGFRFRQAEAAYRNAAQAAETRAMYEGALATLAKMLDQYNGMDEPPLPPQSI